MRRLLTQSQSFNSVTETCAPDIGCRYPYCALAMLAVFTHASVAVWYRTQSATGVRLVMLSGVAIAALILLAFGGWLYPIATPGAYQRYYDSLIAW